MRRRRMGACGHPTRRGGSCARGLLLALSLLTVMLAVGQAKALAADIRSDAPLTDISLNNDLSCAVSRMNVVSNFADSTCGTFLSMASGSNQSRLYAPGSLWFNPSTGSNASAFTPVSQTPVTGSGTTQDPYRVVTVVAAEDEDQPTGVQVSQTDSYVTGEALYRSVITVTNTSGSTWSGKLYQLSYCRPGDTEYTYGSTTVTSFGKAVACSQTPNNSPPSLLVQYVPLTAGSHSAESDSVWNTINAHADLSDTCECTERHGSGVALNWDFASLAPGQSVTFSSISNFSSPEKPPLVSTEDPAPSNSSVAELKGSVNPQGPPTTTYFQYGLDRGYTQPRTSGPDYTASTPPQPAGADFWEHPAWAWVSGLVPNARYHVRLVAVNRAGTTYGADRTFLTPPGPPPGAPKLGADFNAAPLSGQVYVVHGNTRVPLTESAQLPAGTVLDARHGSVSLHSATGKGKGTQSATAGGAAFRVSQIRSGRDKGLTILTMLEGTSHGAPSYSSCKRSTPRVLQSLSIRAAGRFRVRGRYAQGTARGARWRTADRCDGTLVNSERGTLALTDLTRHLGLRLAAGRRYLVIAPRRRR